MLFQFFLFHLSFYWECSFGNHGKNRGKDRAERKEEKPRLKIALPFIALSLTSLWHWLPCLIISFQTVEPVRPAVTYLRYSILLWQTCQHLIALRLLYSFLKQYLFIIGAWKLSKRKLSKELRHLFTCFKSLYFALFGSGNPLRISGSSAPLKII